MGGAIREAEPYLAAELKRGKIARVPEAARRSTQTLSRGRRSRPVPSTLRQTSSPQLTQNICTSTSACAKSGRTHPAWRGQLFAIKETYLRRTAHGRAIHAKLSLAPQMSSRKVRSRASLRGQRPRGRENSFQWKGVPNDCRSDKVLT